MQEDGVWRTINGRRVFIKNKDVNDYMNDKIRGKKTEEEKEQYFNEHFYFEDGDYYRATFFNEQDDSKDYLKDKDWDSTKKGYDIKEAGLVKKRIAVKDKNTNAEVGFIKYKEVYDNSRTSYTSRINIDEIVVKDNYRRKGIATQLYKEVQRRAGNEDIYFGELTPKGKKLIEKIGTITKKEDGKYPDYWGRINL